MIEPIKKFEFPQEEKTWYKNSVVKKKEKEKIEKYACSFEEALADAQDKQILILTLDSIR